MSLTKLYRKIGKETDIGVFEMNDAYMKIYVNQFSSVTEDEQINDIKEKLMKFNIVIDDYEFCRGHLNIYYHLRDEE